MPTEITISIASIIGMVVGYIVKHFLSRSKNMAEIEKLKAETEKTKADTEKTRSELLAPKAASETIVLTPSKENALIERILEKVRDIQENLQSQSVSTLYKPPSLSERLIYLYTVRHDIENKIREIVLSFGGSWMGATMASFDSYFEKALEHKLITEVVASEIYDFYYYTQPIINSGDVSDSEHLRIQYLAANINHQLDYVLQNIPKLHE
jgi:hypothetical protein